MRIIQTVADTGDMQHVVDKNRHVINLASYIRLKLGNSYQWEGLR